LTVTETFHVLLTILSLYNGVLI